MLEQKQNYAIMRTIISINCYVSKTTLMLCLLALSALFSCYKEKVLPVDDDEEVVPVDEVVQEEIPYSTVLKVGADKPFKTVSEASANAGDSTLIEVDAGTYSGDVALWTQNNLIIRAVGGEVILDANGKNTGGKGIWEINGGRISVEGITFKNAKVPDENGAGIRLTKGDLTVVDCRFLRNETGILTSNDGVSTLTVRNSEFGYNSHDDGFSHNLYVGYIAKLSVSGSYFHHASTGHLLKSRAAQSVVMYNRLTDETDDDSRASYELDFPSGGQAVVVGNIIQQSKNTENPSIISYAKEVVDNKYPHPVNELYLCYNTVFNSRTQTDILINALSSPSIRFVVYNNLLSENIRHLPDLILYVEKSNQSFVSGDLNSDYSPTQNAFNKWKNFLLETDIDNILSSNLKAQGISLIPTKEYVHPLNTKELKTPPQLPGAIQTIN
jgi:hypothetical protein